MSKKTWMIIAGIFAVAVIGLQAYQIFVKGIIDTHDLLRTAIILLGLLVAYSKFGTESVRGIELAKKTFKRDYAEHIGNAFEGKKDQENLFYGALIKFNNNKNEAAIKKLERLRCETPQEHYTALFFTALCYDDAGVLDTAADYYEKALAYKRSVTALSNQGVCYEHMGDVDRALQCYRDALAVEETDLVLSNISQLYLRLGDYKESLGYAEAALEKNAGLDPALSAAAVDCAMLGYEDRYDEYYRRYVTNGRDGDDLKEFINMLRSSKV